MRCMYGLGLFAHDCQGVGRSCAGGLCIFWKEDVRVEFSFLLRILLIYLFCGGFWFYVPNGTSDCSLWFLKSQLKWRTWELVQGLQPADEVPWLCCGDFNDVISPKDKRGEIPLIVHINRLFMGFSLLLSWWVWVSLGTLKLCVTKGRSLIWLRKDWTFLLLIHLGGMLGVSPGEAFYPL